MNKNGNLKYADAKGNDVNPWYREPWPWIVFGIPAFTVVASFTLLFIAYNNPPNVLAKQTPSLRKGGVMAMNAQTKKITANITWNAENKLLLKLSSLEKIIDKSLSVVLLEISNPDSSSPPKTIGSSIYLDLLPINSNNGDEFLATKEVSLEFTQKSYWLEIIGDKGGWALHGILSPQGFKVNN